MKNFMRRKSVVISFVLLMLPGFAVAQTSTTPSTVNAPDIAMPVLTNQCNRNAGTGRDVGTALMTLGSVAIGLCLGACTGSWGTAWCSVGSYSVNGCVGVGVGAVALFSGHTVYENANSIAGSCAAAQAAITSAAPSGTGGSNTTTTPFTTTNSTTGTLPPAVQQALDKSGVQFNPSTGNLTLPNGTTMTPAQAQAAMGSGGAGQQALGGLVAEAKKEAADGGSAVAGVENDSEGSGAALASGSRGSSNGFNGGLVGTPGGAAAKRGVANVAAGTTKIANNGDAIGAKYDNIFLMVNRRFNSMSTQNQLLLPAAQVAAPVGP